MSLADTLKQGLRSLADNPLARDLMQKALSKAQEGLQKLTGEDPAKKQEGERLIEEAHADLDEVRAVAPDAADTADTAAREIERKRAAGEAGAGGAGDPADDQILGGADTSPRPRR